jgi:hypothetical protein
MRSGTLEPLANAIAHIVTDGQSDVVVFKYLEKEQALFVHYFFYYRVLLEDMLAASDLSAILNIAAFKDIATPDRAVISLDAVNFKEEGPAAGFVIEPGGSRRNDVFDDIEIDTFDALIGEHFFKFSDEFGAHGAPWRTNSRVLDRKLRRKVDRLLEMHRLRVANERIPDGTPLQPVRLCDHFHYNGHFVVFSGHTLCALPQLDPRSFRQTPYGAADAQYAVVGHEVIRTDPDRFKMLHKGETIFYKDAEHIYDEQLAPVPGADPKTFKLIHYAFARDSKRWYSGSVPLDDVGNHAKIDDALYFRDLCLLSGEQSMYLGASRLPLDASSCRLIRSEKFGNHPPFKGLLWFADKDGDCIVSKVIVPRGEPIVEVRRTSDPERLWEEIKPQSRPPESAATALYNAMPEHADDPQTQGAFVAFFDEWLAANFERYRREGILDDYLWQGINNYFYCCWHLGKPQKIIDLYAKVEAEAWVKPMVFHHTACAFVAVDKLDRAVGEIRRGIIFGYTRANEFFTDPDLARLSGREDFERLKAATLPLFDGSAPRRRQAPVPGELLRHVLSDIPERLQEDYVKTILSNFFVPGSEDRAQLKTEDAIDMPGYEETLAEFFNHVTLGEHLQRAYDTYSAWGDLPGIHPAAHLIAASSFLREGFFWVDQGAELLPTDRTEFKWAMIALRRAKKALAADPKWTDDPAWRKVSADPTLGLLLDLAQ